MHDARLRFNTGAATHVGMVRQRNEDSFLVRPDAGLWAVADGMGGEQSGDLASHTVIEALHEIPAPSTAAELLEHCEARVVEANNALKRIASERGDGAVVGTTIAVLLIFDSYYACVWAGDSRIYRVRDGVIEQMSRDHTEVQELVQEGVLSPEEARNHPARNVITRAIGIYEEPELEMEHGALAPGDAFVICSDGLFAHVGENEMLDYVVSGGPQEACDAMIALTLERGAVDNVTVIVVRYIPVDVSAVAPADHQSPDTGE